MPSIFDPLTIRSVTMRNRFGVSPMCMYSCEEGFATDWHLVHLGSRAVGGYGMVMAEASAVEARGRITPEDQGIWLDAHVEPLARTVRFMKEHGAVPAIQLAHAGRKASTSRPFGNARPNAPLSAAEGGWEIVGPSAVAFDEGYQVPRELTVGEIRATQELFVAAAGWALEAGYEILELHGAHGYLINSFLSPLANRRTDLYGGSFENRIRFLVETVRGVRKVWPERLPLWVRLSCTDWADERGGWRLEDSVALAKVLKGEGVDLIDCSSGALVPHVKIPVAPGYQVPFAEAIRKEAGILTAAVGMITEPGQADRIVLEGQADVVLTAREALRDPYFPRHAALALMQGEAVRLPGQYGRA